MSSANVRHIESVEAFQSILVRYSDDLCSLAEQLRGQIRHVQHCFDHDYPAYWKQQTQLAERKLTEAKDNLAAKRATIRAADRPPATEAAQRVATCQARLRHCEKQQRTAAAVKLRVAQQVDQLLGPLADVHRHGETDLPAAAIRLKIVIDQLRAYHDA